MDKFSTPNVEELPRKTSLFIQKRLGFSKLNVYGLGFTEISPITLPGFSDVIYPELKNPLRNKIDCIACYIFPSVYSLFNS